MVESQYQALHFKYIQDLQAMLQHVMSMVCPLVYASVVLLLSVLVVVYSFVQRLFN